MDRSKGDSRVSSHGEPLSAYQMLEAEFALLHGDESQGSAPPEDPEDAEVALRRRIHALPEGEKRTALCLSGGGIRSATFSLGDLQGLADSGWLGRFHYLSTVSGGGYVGSWLSSWIQREGFQKALDGLARSRPGAPRQAEAEPAPIRRLRSYSNYLSPVWGLSIDFVTLIFTFIRNLLVHWLVFIPLLMAVLILPRINIVALGWNSASGAFLGSSLVLCLLLAVFAIAYVVSDLPGAEAHRPSRELFRTRCFPRIIAAAVLLSWTWDWAVISQSALPLDWSLRWYLGGAAALHVIGVGVGLLLRQWRAPAGASPIGSRNMTGNIADWALIVGSGAAGGAILYFGATYLFPPDWLRSGPPEAIVARRELYATFSVPFLLTGFWLGTAVYTGLARRVSTEDDREWWARSGAYWILASMGWILAHVVVIYGPRWLLQAAGASDIEGVIALIGSGGLVSGLLTSVIGYFSKKGLGRLAQPAEGLLTAVGRRSLDIAAALFIAILLLGLNFLVSLIVDPMGPFAAAHAPEQALSAAHTRVLGSASGLVLLAWLLVLAGFGVGVSWIIGVNTFSLHGMYGNRLVRAYLGATRVKRRPHLFTGFDPDDNLKMALLAKTGKRLFHVVNIALNIVKATDNRLEWQQRKAASFTVSGLHCGSKSLGYQPSASYSDEISLGRAMTISGAAASPNMGYHTSPLVAFVMAFFNVRLGWWLPNPSGAGRGVWSRSEPSLGVRPLIDETLSRTTDRQPYVYLSDGGHFDNLGLYEMVYRRCHEIVVVDAGCDPNYEFEDFENAVRKIRTDLGIPIEFPGGLPTPQNARAAGRHFVVGRIRYSVMDRAEVDDKSLDDQSLFDGRLIYIKPVLSGDEPLDVQRYGAAHNDPRNPFPHQSTRDQFFDEPQFESYRELGYHGIATQFRHDKMWHELAEQPSQDTPAPSPPPAAAEAKDGSGDLQKVIEKSSAAAAAAPAVASVGWFATSALPGWLALIGIPAAAWVVFVTSGPPTTPTPDPKVAPILREVTSLPVLVVPPSLAGTIDRVMLPLFEEAKGCDGNPATCARGVKLDAGALALVRVFTEALADCASGPGIEVVVEIRGYSSSSEFKGGGGSALLNQELANARAEAVGDAMEKAKGEVKNGARLKIRVRKWHKYDSMVEERRYVDDDGGFSEVRGALNRRVDVVFEELGNCTPKDLVGRTKLR